MSDIAAVRAVNLLKWNLDTATVEAAGEQRLSMLRTTPAEQWTGSAITRATWDRHVVQPATWHDPLRSHPLEIIKEFAAGSYTQGLALVVSWGRMWRQLKKIYDDESPETILRIEQTLSRCATDIRATQSIESAWQLLTGKGADALCWSAVMASKALHFLCRALGYEHNPPVSIDGKVIRQRLWPLFRYSLPPGRSLEDWDGDEFRHYGRYMTAILTWAAQRQWTTTQMEATIYDHFKRS